MLGYLFLDIIYLYSSKVTVFLELGSRKTESFEEQIMSKEYIFPPKRGYCVYCPSRVVLRIGK